MHRSISLSLHMRCVAFVLFNRLVVSILRNALWEPLNNSHKQSEVVHDFVVNERHCTHGHVHESFVTNGCIQFIRRKHNTEEEKWIVAVHSFRDCCAAFVFRYVLFYFFYFFSISFSNETKQKRSERERRRSWNRREKKNETFHPSRFCDLVSIFAIFMYFVLVCRFAVQLVFVSSFFFLCFYSIRRCHFYVYFCSVRIYASSIVVSTLFFSIFSLCLTFRCSSEHTASPSSHQTELFKQRKLYAHCCRETWIYIFFRLLARWRRWSHHVDCCCLNLVQREKTNILFIIT